MKTAPKIHIQNGRVIDPANGTDEVRDIFIEAGKIVSAPANAKDIHVIDASGQWVVPGFIDLHTHLRDPGFRHKETIATGSRAAAMGGFTTICAMANTDPVTDNEVVVEYILSKARKTAVVNVHPVGALSKNLQGESLSAIGSMAEAGIVALSDDGKTIENPALLKTAMQYAKMFGLPIFSHCEDARLTGRGQMHAGSAAELMGLRGIPAEAEESIVARDIILARMAGVRLHICHVSAARSLDWIRRAKAEGQAVTAEVCPHHFTLCDEDITEYDANFKMSPPLRSKADVAALKAALKDGTIDAIATDHAPHHEDDKNCEFEAAQNGIVGLETALPLSLALVEEGVLTPSRLIEMLSANPARILNFKDKGSLAVDACADVVIIDPAAAYTIDKYRFASLSRNTPFHGRPVKGRAIHTIVGGRLVVEGGKLVDGLPD